MNCTRSASTGSKPIILALLLIGAMAPPAVADPAVDRQVHQALDQGLFLGCVVMVGRPNEVLFHKAYGQRDLDRPMLVDSIFDLASITKPVTVGTGLAITMTRHDQMELDDRAADYLPGLGGRGGQEMTIRHLATHRSGLDNTKSLQARFEGEALIRAILNHDTSWPVGSGYRYSCLGIIRLSEMIATINDQEFGVFCRENIFLPLGMADTYQYQVPPEKVDRCVRFVTDLGRPSDTNARRAGRAVGNAGLFSTAYDLSKVATLWLQDGAYDNQRIFSKEVGRRMMREGIVWKTGRGSTTVPDNLSPNTISHTGYTGQTLIVDPEVGGYVIVLTNLHHPAVDCDRGESYAARGRIAEALVDAFLLDGLKVDPTVTVSPGQSAELSGKAAGGAGGGRTLCIGPVGTKLGAVSQPIPGSDSESRLSPFSVALPVPETMPIGRYMLPVELVDQGGRRVAATGTELVVQPPVGVRLDAEFAQAGRPQIRATLDNRTDCLIEGTLAMSLRARDMDESEAPPGPQAQASFTLQPGHDQSIVLPIDPRRIEPARRYVATTQLELADGNTYDDRQTIYFMGAPRVADRIKLDGNLDDWPEVRPAHLIMPTDVIRSGEFCPPGFAAEIRYAWDEQKLYLGAKVVNPQFVQERTGRGTWQHDCLQMGFDLDRMKAQRHRRVNTRPASEITVALAPDGLEFYRTQTHDRQRLPTGRLRAPRASGAVVHVNGITLYEIAFEWAALGLDPDQSINVGDVLGVAIAVNDVRRADQPDPSALGLFRGMTPRKNPDAYGRVHLLGPSSESQKPAEAP